MSPATDTELLRRYVEERSETAFAELVGLHVNLVYFAALRQVGGDAHRAQEVAQSVFTDLARKAASLTGRTTLTGWLHTSTRFAATKARRADFTRQQHEQEATTMNALLSDSDPARPELVEGAAEWERLRPMIDDVIHELDDRDREAVLLRYFANRPFAEVGAALRLSEDAARMRVDRALDKLRAALARRGVSSTSAALAAVFANQVGATAPVGLAAALSSAALASVGASGAAAASAGLLFMSKTTAILGAVALAAIGLMIFEWNHAFRAESELAALTVDRDGLRAQLRTEQQQAERAAREAAALRDEVAALKMKPIATTPPPTSPPTPTAAAPVMTDEQLQQEMRRASINKAVKNNLRQIAATTDAFQKKYGRPPTSLDEVVGEGKFIRALVPVNGESYATLSLVPGTPLSTTTADGTTISFDPSTPLSAPTPPTPAEMHIKELTQRLAPTIQTAIANYGAAHDGAKPQMPQDLLPYFATPQEGADFVELIDAQKAIFLEQQKAAKK